jgi:hypothetical protein
MAWRCPGKMPSTERSRCLARSDGDRMRHVGPRQCTLTTLRGRLGSLAASKADQGLAHGRRRLRRRRYQQQSNDQSTSIHCQNPCDASIVAIAAFVVAPRLDGQMPIATSFIDDEYPRLHRNWDRAVRRRKPISAFEKHTGQSQGPQGRDLSAIMHHVAHFFTSGWRSSVGDPSVWIGVRQLAAQRIGD